MKKSIYYKGFSVFKNLTEFQLCWDQEGIHDWDEVVKILQDCPKLQTLKIQKVSLSHPCIVTRFYMFSSPHACICTNPIFFSDWQARCSTTIKDWEYLYHVPKCLSSHLTTCKIIHYEAAFEADFRFASYILKNARLLQDMTIYPRVYNSNTEPPRFSICILLSKDLSRM